MIELTQIGRNGVEYEVRLDGKKLGVVTQGVRSWFATRRGRMLKDNWKRRREAIDALKKAAGVE